MYSSRSSLLIGFHGCDESVSKQLLTKPKTVKISEKPFDWLGNGFYVWENNYSRALEWAKDKQKRGEIKKASVPLFDQPVVDFNLVELWLPPI